jgi:type I protein arginine methyltransferase
MYEFSDYGLMLGDRRRLAGYTTALRRFVAPGAVVVEIGAGPGFLSVLACQLGARRVYAIEPNDVIQLAREIASANRCADVMVCLQDLSTRVTLPERADVIVSDLRDVLPLFDHHIPSIVDARDRFLAPGGVLVPQHDTLWGAVVDAPELHARVVGAWDGSDIGVDMQAGRRLAVNSWSKARVRPDQLVVEPRQWATIDYTTVTSPNVAGEMDWLVDRAGWAHGLCLWFEACLAPDVRLSNAPGDPELLYGTAFFPWPKPVHLSIADRVHVRVRADLVGADYVWQWETRITPIGPKEGAQQFRQSTFYGQLLPVLPVEDVAIHRHADAAPAAATVGTGLRAIEPTQLANARSGEYWRSLNPELALEQRSSSTPLEVGRLETSALSNLVDGFRANGYFEMPGALSASTIGAMRSGVDTLRRHGWPAVFAFVYDEFWLAPRSAPIAAFLTAVLGPGYRQIPHVWTHYVEPVPGRRGWPPHSDSPQRSNRITVWLALTDATLDNGCIYVVPRSHISAQIAARLPDASELAMADVDALLHGSRALPTAAGGALGWNFDVVHWGSICTKTGQPRIATSQEFIAASELPATDEQPLFDTGSRLPTLEERLRAIAKAILAYDRFDSQPEYTVLAEHLYRAD